MFNLEEYKRKLEEYTKEHLDEIYNDFVDAGVIFEDVEVSINIDEILVEKINVTQFNVESFNEDKLNNSDDNNPYSVAA